MEYGKAEMMCVALAREIKDGDVVFHGLASPVPMTAMKLAKALGTNFTYVTLVTGGCRLDQAAVIGSTLTSNTYEGGVATFGLDEIFDLAGTGRWIYPSSAWWRSTKRAESICPTSVGLTISKVRMPGGAVVPPDSDNQTDYYLEDQAGYQIFRERGHFYHGGS